MRIVRMIRGCVVAVMAVLLCAAPAGADEDGIRRALTQSGIYLEPGPALARGRTVDGTAD